MSKISSLDFQPAFAREVDAISSDVAWKMLVYTNESSSRLAEEHIIVS